MKSDCLLNNAQRQVLELLSAALTDREPLEGLFTSNQGADWEDIITLADQQSISALVYERILKLPKEQLPDRGRRIPMALYIEQVHQHHKQYIEKQHQIYSAYDERGLSPVLLKGISLSQLYPHPELRLLGDIDIYLPTENAYKEANLWAKSYGREVNADSLYEKAFWYKSILIENHKYITYFGIPRYDASMNDIIGAIQRQNTWQNTEIGGINYRTLPTELNAVYIFHHILHHFSYLGIGLRQISDWLLYMQRYGTTMNRELFLRYTNQFDLLRPMQLFALMSVRHLGISHEIYPFDLPSDNESERLADLIIQDTFTGGNFGFEHFKGRSFSNIWFRRWFMFKRTTYRSFRIATISPEHIRLIPLIAIATRIKLLVRKVFSY